MQQPICEGKNSFSYLELCPFLSIIVSSSWMQIKINFQNKLSVGQKKT